MTRFIVSIALATSLFAGAAAPALALNIHVPKSVVLAAVAGQPIGQDSAAPVAPGLDIRDFALGIAHRISGSVERLVPGIVAAARGIAGQADVADTAETGLPGEIVSL